MNFVVQFNSKADILMDKLSKLADGKTQIDLFAEMNHATLDAIALVCIIKTCIYLEYILCKFILRLHLE